MSRAKITITMDEHAIAEIDQPGRRPRETIYRSKLAIECAKLDPTEEQALAEEAYAGEVNGPNTEYNSPKNCVTAEWRLRHR